MPFHDDRGLRKLQHVVIADAEPLAIGGRRFHVAGGRMPPGIDHPLLLAAQPARQHGAESAVERRLVHIELVGIHGPLDDIFAEAIGAGHEHHVAKAGFGVERESDAACGEIGADHLHDRDRQCDLEMIEAIVDAIGDRAIREQRGEAAPARIHQIARPANIEEAVVLACEARGRQIFGGGRAAHGDREICDRIPVRVGDRLPPPRDAGLPDRWRRRRWHAPRRRAWRDPKSAACRARPAG